MIYDAARVRRLCTKFQVNTSKNKNFSFEWGGGGALVRYIGACAVEIQDMMYNVARVRRLSTKFQADTCKCKEDRSANAQLRTL